MRLTSLLLITVFSLAICAGAGAASYLGIQEKFEIPELDMLKNFTVTSPGSSQVLLDRNIYHSGKSSLKLQSFGNNSDNGSSVGITSRAIPYKGQLINVSIWMKIQDVTVGSAPWYAAAIQVYSYNSDGKEIGHKDIAIKDGTSDWNQYKLEFRLSRTVAYIKLVCHLWGDCKGTAWFDDADVKLINDRISLLPHRIDLKNAAVTVDCSKKLGDFRHIWIGTDGNYTDRVATQSGINALQKVRHIGFKYIRLHDCIVNTSIYSEDPQGKPAYNWKLLDTGISALLDNGLLPVIVLETMPPELAKRNSGQKWTNPYPPKDDEDYLKWQELVYQFVKHCAHKWGDSIHNWYFEVWNEPEASGYFEGTQKEYLRIYDHAIAGATKADPEIKIGGIAGASYTWCRAFLEHCANGRNDATGKRGVRTDFFSWHIYTTGTGIPVFDDLKVSLASVKSTIRAYPQYSKLPLLITEWGCSSSLFPPHDRPYDAAFRTMAVKEFMDNNITLAFPFCLAETPYDVKQGFRGDLSMYTQTTVPKPYARAFELLNGMYGQRLKCISSNDPVGGLACISNDRQSIKVILYNLIEDYTRPEYSTAVKIKMASLSKGKWVCKRTSIAPGTCDPYAKWLELGSPNPFTQEQQNAIMKASQLPEAEVLEIKSGIIKINMPGSSVTMLELKKQN